MAAVLPPSSGAIPGAAEQAQMAINEFTRAAYDIAPKMSLLPDAQSPLVPRYMPPPELKLHEKLLAFLGLNTPTLRLVAGATIASAALFYYKPSFAFDHKGRARKWALTSPALTATFVPWWSVSILAGFVLGVAV